MKLRGRTALLLGLPFAIVGIGAQGMVPSWGDGVARRMGDLAPWLARPPRAVAESSAGGASRDAVSSSDPGDTPSAGSVNGGAATKPGVVQWARADAGAGEPLPPVTIGVALVQRAIDDSGRTVHARTIDGPDGKPAGVRVTGINGARIGVHDGDVIVEVDGKPTIDEDAATDAALSVVARGDRILRAKLTRDGEPFLVTLQLPPVPIDAGKNAR